MFGLNGTEGLLLLVPLLLGALGLLALHGAVRLAVRHGVLDTRGRRRSAPGRDSDALP